MNAEIEAKFLDANFDELRAKLTEAGAECHQPMRQMRRAIIETSALRAQDSFLRIRDEGDKTTLTFKRVEADTVDGTKEIEVTVSDFDTTAALLAEAGLPYTSLQESKRETWQLNGVEIVLDEWPWLKPYIEIEGESEAAVRQTAEKLGFDWGNAVFGGVMAAYRADYPHISDTDTVANLKEVKFGDPLPELFAAR